MCLLYTSISKVNIPQLSDTWSSIADTEFAAQSPSEAPSVCVITPKLQIPRLKSPQLHGLHSGLRHGWTSPITHRKNNMQRNPVARRPLAATRTNCLQETIRSLKRHDAGFLRCRHKSQVVILDLDNSKHCGIPCAMRLMLSASEDEVCRICGFADGYNHPSGPDNSHACDSTNPHE